MKKRKYFEGCLAALAAIVTLAVFIHAISTRPGSDGADDEVEFLHAMWLIRGGERIFQDFFEHHSPLFFLTFAKLFDFDTPYYVLQIRLACFSVFCLTAAMFSQLVAREFVVGKNDQRLSLGLAVYIAFVVLVWPCRAGEIRPETLGIFFLIAGATIGRLIALRKPMHQLMTLLTLMLCLGFAASFSPRCVLPGAAIVVWSFWRVERRFAFWGRAIFATLLAASIVLAINAVAAPYTDTFFWFIKFSSLLQPIYHLLPLYDKSALISELAIFIATLRIIFIGLHLFIFRSEGWLYRFTRSFGSAAEATSWFVRSAFHRRIIILEVLLALAWASLFLEHRWFQQSLIPIALIEALWVSAVLAFAIKAALSGDESGICRVGQSVLVVATAVAIMWSHVPSWRRSNTWIDLRASLAISAAPPTRGIFQISRNSTRLNQSIPLIGSRGAWPSVPCLRTILGYF
jgi:hypothetical protein